MPSNPREMMQAVISNMPSKTGKSIEQWVELVKKDGPSDPKQQVRWLKDVHNLGHVTAQIIVASAEGRGNVYDSEQKLIDGLFGKKPELKEIYDEVLRAIKPLPEVKVQPCKTYVPFSHRRQFALVKPHGNTHLDLHLALGDHAPASPRLSRTKSRDGRMSHVVSLAAPQDVDTEVREWLKRAYDAAG